MLRSAYVNTTDVDRVAAFLPSNYKCALVRFSDGTEKVLIAGSDSSGWTLDGYVIPRLASGLLFATEIVS